ncbi:P-loop containing nucleoside triphosphate hydrolase protein [Aspergillus affinis]|uniref:P-loop containing nucleoside triphosphate hydrolase protein n=1 Tax=Aspergillus affinis TaxID=1070780 RepID=UPI0022FECD6D|nr:P-loop containing nucleoside triphosphate hydrolase protein [Aspergillus affinis]KAI9040111.1 P-loop containing nucleoside triphosphate hydrolase protein [Aspergillus affinis]
MASSTNDASIEDVLDDLQLNQVILESLDQERPDAVVERQEILDTIKDLEARLAALRGDPPASFQSQPSSHGPADHTDVTRPQLDDRSDASASWSFQSNYPRDSPLFVAPSNMRKRQRNEDVVDEHEDGDEDAETDYTDDLELPAKRVRTSRPSDNSSYIDRSSPSMPTDDGADELQKLLGLDSRDTLLRLQEDQRKAEQWLEIRKEQERRDEEFARRLNEGFHEPHRPSPPVISAHHGIISTFPGPSLSAEGRGDQWSSYRDPSHDPSHDPSRPKFRAPLLPDRSRTGSERYPVPIAQDSDDSDLAEITEGDFQRHTRSPSTHYTDGIHSHPWMPRRPEADRFESLPPGGFGVSGPVYGPSVFQNTLARLNAGKQLFEQAGRSLFGSDSSPFSSHRGPGMPFPDHGGPEYPYYDMFPDLYGQGEDPQKINDDIKQLLETIRPDSDISKENREGTPEALKLNLLEHQKLGLAWMKSLEEQEQKGGILADDMGLGKTIQAIALMVARPPEDPERKPTLIIAPVALMQQWKREIHRVLKPGQHQLSVYVLHGDKRAVGFRDLRDYDVVLTTFGTLSSELKRREKYDELHGHEPTESRELLKSMPCLGPSSKWYRVIIDEAQCIKNRNTKAAIACCRLDSIYRWCMSGTPMMNSVQELHSLLKFLRIRPYGNLERFNHDFTRPLKSGSASAQEKAMKQLQVLLKAVLLRRTKESKIDGKPILQLPRRVSEKVHAVFSDDEQELYSALEAQTQLQFNKYLEAGTVGRNYSNILVLLLRLRQACCHPHLIKDYSVKLNANTDELDLVENAKAFGNEVVIRLKGNSDLECPICIDAVDNPIIFFPCGHSTCAECFSRISDPELSVRQGHDGSVDVKCPNCRGKVDPKKITDHMSFKKVHFPDESSESAALELPKPAEADEDDSDDSDQDSLSRFIVSDDENNKTAQSSKRKKKGKMPQKIKKTLADLKREASKNQKSKRKYLRRLDKTWISSAKIDKVMDILRDVQLGEAKEKTIIFSQFTALLDLLEVPIMRSGWGYRRYDGSMKPADRNSAVLDFTDNPDCRIMLVSLKAGNAGLNLVAASQVIIFDPFWNPYIEEQAIDRAHRIGQLREVHVHRILVEKTVEDRILELQDKKREIIEGALDENASKSISRLGTRELAYLFSEETKHLYRERLATAPWVGFDLDNTLHEFRYASACACNTVFETISERHGISTTFLQDRYVVILQEMTSNAFSDGRSSYDYRRGRFVALLDSFKIGIDLEFVNELLTRYESSLEAALTLKDGAVSLLSDLKRRGKNIVVITEGPQDSQEWTIEKLGIAKYIDYLATTNRFKTTKTTGLFDRVLKHLGISPDDIVYIGDNMDRDIVPAVEEGILCIYLGGTQSGWIGDGHFRVSELAEIQKLLED